LLLLSDASDSRLRLKIQQMKETPATHRENRGSAQKGITP
jgi:hypothetical protein